MEIGDLADLVEDKINAAIAVPVHIVRRLHLLLGSETPVFVDATAKPADASTSGIVVIFTEKRVICATWTDTPRRPEDGATPYTGHASTWPRSGLTGLDVASNAESKDNSDKSWTDDYGDLWPYDAYVRLGYEGAPELKLPLSDEPTKATRQELRDFVASLIGDL